MIRVHLTLALAITINYPYGEIEDNFESTMTDYYPGDTKSVFIALAHLTQAIPPFRLMSRFNIIGRSLIAACTVLTLIGSIIGVVLFCKGAAMRWTLYYRVMPG
jgi:hypothetical protein